MSASSSSLVMRALTQSAYGPSSSSLSLSVSTPRPSPSATQLLVRIHAASINPIDYKLARGDLSLLISRRFPLIPGFDLSGTVVEVGSACTGRIKVGDEVWGDVGINNGAYADYIAVKENLIALKPINFTFAEAASVPLAALTSYQCLYHSIAPTRLSSSSRLLLIGGSGGTGVYGLQIARAMGCTNIVTTASTRNIEFVQQQGAERALDYTLTGEQHWLNKLKNEIQAGTTPPFDVIYACAGGREEWDAASGLLKRGGCYITITGDSQAKATVGSTAKLVGSLIHRSVAGRFGSHIQYTYWLTKTDGWKHYVSDMDQLKQWAEEGKLKPVVEKVYEMEEGIRLFEASAAGKARGKLVLAVSSEAHTGVHTTATTSTVTTTSN